MLASPPKTNSASTQKMNSASTQKMNSASTQKMNSASTQLNSVSPQMNLTSSIPLLFTHAEINTYYQQINNILPPGMVLMNKAQFLDWWAIKPNPVQLTRHVRNKLRITRKNQRSDIRNENQEIELDVGQKLAKIACNNHIGDVYGKIASENIFLDEPQFDILVAVYKPDQLNLLVRSKTLEKQKLNKVAGFLIAEYGECKDLPNSFSVNLICSKQSMSIPKIKGTVLLGAYLYCIKSNTTIDPIGLLELAGGYTNVAGIISYSKLGFRENLDLFKGTCFLDAGNLPMNVNVNSITYDQIIDTVKNVSSITFASDSLELNSFLSFRPKNDRENAQQERILLFLNELYKTRLHNKILTSKMDFPNIRMTSRTGIPVDTTILEAEIMTDIANLIGSNVVPPINPVPTSIVPTSTVPTIQKSPRAFRTGKSVRKSIVSKLQKSPRGAVRI